MSPMVVFFVCHVIKEMGVTVERYSWRGIAIPSCYMNIRRLVSSKGASSYEFSYDLQVFVNGDLLTIDTVKFESNALSVESIWDVCYAHLKGALASFEVVDNLERVVFPAPLERDSDDLARSVIPA